MQGKDTLPVVAAAAVGTTLGAVGGKSVEIGNKYFHLVSDKTAGMAGAVGGKSVEIGNKYFPLVSDKTAGMAGAVGGSLASEIIGSKIEGHLKSAGDDK